MQCPDMMKKLVSEPRVALWYMLYAPENDSGWYQRNTGRQDSRSSRRQRIAVTIGLYALRTARIRFIHI